MLVLNQLCSYSILCKLNKLKNIQAQNFSYFETFVSLSNKDHNLRDRTSLFILIWNKALRGLFFLCKKVVKMKENGTIKV